MRKPEIKYCVGGQVLPPRRRDEKGVLLRLDTVDGLPPRNSVEKYTTTQVVVLDPSDAERIARGLQEAVKLIRQRKIQ